MKFDLPLIDFTEALKAIRESCIEAVYAIGIVFLVALVGGTVAGIAYAIVHR